MAITISSKNVHKVLPLDFYSRKTDVVARDLLGKLLMRKIGNKTLSAKIVETEAYFGNGKDPASHAHKGPTPRSEIMFKRSGIAYVYFNYGVHWLLNFVAKEDGDCGAVLIRGVQPVDGVETMLKNRDTKVSNLTNGPAKLTQAFKIDGALNGADVTTPRSSICVSDFLTPDFEIKKSKRVGINKGKEQELRFFIKDNAFVSK